MNSVIYTAAAAFALAGAAVATPAAAANAQGFTGPFVGVQGGWEENDVRNPGTALGVTPLAQTSDTGTLGVFMGYDQEVYPRIVVGAQAEVNFPISSRFGNGLASISPKRSVDLSLRAGYLVTPKTLAYVRGGYSNALTGANIGNIHGSDDRDGWLLGGGVERKLTDKVSARVEYRYSDFSEGNGRFDRHQIFAGVAYRF
ncbi:MULTISPECIES: outer membrane protein [unclassified Novosphingobium]|uniref:outer membrane protein n=1 Tax=unclassified Novosphingobium TaxID=2644732 RepID=UPI000AAAA98F|nr:MULTISPECIES: outer membrane beta-barrel protein [unclassified Novosphingobium]MBN9144568.1 porin family protein [Novosphingobium sp.]MDR6707900.1 outer membrane immunogenic protein [Novosphingobium sp. 1748]